MTLCLLLTNWKPSIQTSLLGWGSDRCLGVHCYGLYPQSFRRGGFHLHLILEQKIRVSGHWYFLVSTQLWEEILPGTLWSIPFWRLWLDLCLKNRLHHPFSFLRNEPITWDNWNTTGHSGDLLRFQSNLFAIGRRKENQKLESESIFQLVFGDL